MKTEHYLPTIAVYVTGIIVIVRGIYLIFCLLQKIHVFLITGLGYSFTSFFSKYSTFSVIHSIYFITNIILNCQCQWLLYKQNNINTHN